MSRFYFVTYHKQNELWASPVMNAVISEHPTEWLMSINKEHTSDYVIDFYREISEAHYKAAEDTIN